MLQGVDWPIAWSRGNIGARIALLAGDGDGAERELRAAIEGHRAMGDESSLPEFQLTLAQALWAQGRNEEGCELALDIDAPAGRPWAPVARRMAQARWHSVRAEAFARSGVPREGESEARSALAVLEETDSLWWLADTWFALGRVLHVAGRGDEASAAFREALALYEQKGHVVGAERARAALARASQ
jgi:hypothetical protein